MTSLGEALPAEIARCRALLEEYKALGLAGVFGALAIEREIAFGEGAIKHGNVEHQIIAYKRLKELE